MMIIVMMMMMMMIIIIIMMMMIIMMTMMTLIPILIVIDETIARMVTDASVEHASKASSPITVRLLGRVTLVNLEQPLNALPP